MFRSWDLLLEMSVWQSKLMGLLWNFAQLAAKLSVHQKHPSVAGTSGERITVVHKDQLFPLGSTKVKTGKLLGRAVLSEWSFCSLSSSLAFAHC